MNRDAWGGRHIRVWDVRRRFGGGTPGVWALWRKYAQGAICTTVGTRIGGFARDEDRRERALGAVGEIPLGASLEIGLRAVTDSRFGGFLKSPGGFEVDLRLVKWRLAIREVRRRAGLSRAGDP